MHAPNAENEAKASLMLLAAMVSALATAPGEEPQPLKGELPEETA
jgi:hypothetical protein